jgi:hypothetical protein
MLYFDADEHFYFDEINWGSDHSYTFRLFDVYITPDDVDKPFIDREYVGCEYRDITNAYSDQVQEYALQAVDTP